MIRRMILGACIVYGIGLTALGAWLFYSSPGPRSQAVTGVGIGRYDRPGGIAYISGRRLGCEALAAGSAYSTRCTILLAGKPLIINARRNTPPNMNQLGGECAATYNGRAWPCEVGSRHVHTHWFAFIEAPLGLAPPELNALRRQFLFENLPDSVFLRGIAIVVVASSAVTLLASAAVLWPLPDRRYTLAISAVYSGVGFIAASIIALWATGGYWD